MKKYILFDADSYYPVGGLADITGSFETKEEARSKARSGDDNMWHIVDRDTWKIVDQKVFANGWKVRQPE